VAFFVVGGSELLLAAIVQFVLREPPRDLSDPGVPTAVESLGSVLRFIWGLRSLRQGRRGRPS
jgi:hypothetical protein